MIEAGRSINREDDDHFRNLYRPNKPVTETFDEKKNILWDTASIAIKLWLTQPKPFPLQDQLMSG